MDEWFIALSENFTSAPKMGSSCRHKFCHILNSSSTANKSFVFTTAFSTSPFFSPALGLRLGRCRSLLLLLFYLLSKSNNNKKILLSAALLGCEEGEKSHAVHAR